MAKNPKDSKRDLQALFKAPPVKTPTAEERRQVLYYPDAFKRHYMNVLDRYRADLSVKAGKPVGWQTIRDLVMEREDRELAGAASSRWQVEVGTDRPRSPLVTLADFKGWYHPEKSHLPSDIKFQYIERYVRWLRVSGEIDAIERELDQAQLNYIRDALHLFYRPVPYAGDAEILRGINTERIDRLVSHGCFELETPLLQLPPGQTGTCLLLFRDYVSHITPVEILLVRLRQEGPPHIFVPVFSGFLLTEMVFGLVMLQEDVALEGQLMLTRQTAATVGDDGVRVLSEGTTLGTLATFSDNVLELLLEGGEDGQLFGAVFGIEAGSEEATETSRILVRRIDPRRYFPDGEIGRFFRYRPWG